MSYRILVKEALSVIALFMFFLAVLVAVAGLAYLLKEFISPTVRDIFNISQWIIEI
ncbi:MAG: hypothetical protein ABDH32_03670 [Candidatus Caldarchaeales archaeon]